MMGKSGLGPWPLHELRLRPGREKGLRMSEIGGQNTSPVQFAVVVVVAVEGERVGGG